MCFVWFQYEVKSENWPKAGFGNSKVKVRRKDHILVWRLCCYILRRLVGKEKDEYCWVVDIRGYIWQGSSTGVS